MNSPFEPGTMQHDLHIIATNYNYWDNARLEGEMIAHKERYFAGSDSRYWNEYTDMRHVLNLRKKYGVNYRC